MFTFGAKKISSYIHLLPKLLDNLWFTCFFKRIVKLSEPEIWSKKISAYNHFLPTFFYYRGDELQQLLEQNLTAPIIISSQTFRRCKEMLISTMNPLIKYVVLIAMEYLKCRCYLLKPAARIFVCI